MTEGVAIRVAASDEHGLAQAAYRAWDYDGIIEPDAVVFVAERDGAMIGIVRKTVEHGTVMLRGMHIAPTERRQGIGTQLLRAFERTLDTRDCLCIPYTHLVSFYGLAGFTPLEEATAPAFLQERLANYRARGRSVLVMRRRG